MLHRERHTRSYQELRSLPGLKFSCSPVQESGLLDTNIGLARREIMLTKLLYCS